MSKSRPIASQVSRTSSTLARRRSTSAPTEKLTPSAVFAATSIVRGPVAAMSSGGFVMRIDGSMS